MLCTPLGTSRKATDEMHSVEPDLNQRPMDNSIHLLQSTALPTELPTGGLQVNSGLSTL